MKKILVLFSWMFLSLGFIFTTLAYFYHTKSQEKQVAITISAPAINVPTEQNSAQPTSEILGVTTISETQDARAQIVANFLERYDSPLRPHQEYGQKLVDIADEYNIDFRLLPAIAMQESNLCKKAPEGTNNCLGFGIHSKGKLGFDTYEDGFVRAAREIKSNYIDIGLTTPYEIMTKYTPHSDGSWAESVNQWMAEMRYDDRKSGKSLKMDADVLEFTASDSPQVAP